MLASVLKPVDDTRMFEKIGVTLAAEGFEVFIIGYPSTTQNTVPGITFIPLPVFNRRSLKRLLMPWKIFAKINQVKPEVIIVNTPELLVVTALHKILFGRRILYDVLENYYRTIRHTNVYPPVIRFLLATWVRLTEVLLSPCVDAFLLAEKGYAKELNFAKKPVVLENKLPEKISQKYPLERSLYHNLLFSGTLAPTTGVFDAIRLVKELQAIDQNYNLMIIGYAALPGVLSNIRKEINDSPFIKLIGGDKLIPHEEILQEISNAGTGIIIYPNNPATESSIPTKLYEYLALKLPVIISHTQDSTDLVRRSNAGIVLTPEMNAVRLNEKLANSTFTFDYSGEIFWESQAKALVEVIKS